MPNRGEKYLWAKPNFLLGQSIVSFLIVLFFFMLFSNRAGPFGIPGVLFYLLFIFFMIMGAVLFVFWSRRNRIKFGQRQSDADFIAQVAARVPKAVPMALAIRQAFAHLYAVDPTLICADSNKYSLSRFFGRPFLLEFVAQAISELRLNAVPYPIAKKMEKASPEYPMDLMEIIGRFCEAIETINTNRQNEPDEQPQ